MQVVRSTREAHEAALPWNNHLIHRRVDEAKIATRKLAWVPRRSAVFLRGVVQVHKTAVVVAAHVRLVDVPLRVVVRSVRGRNFEARQQRAGNAQTTCRLVEVPLRRRRDRAQGATHG